MWRFEVVAAFLSAGIPLHKLHLSPRLRGLLERGNHPLRSTRILSDYIPLVRNQEMEQLRVELLLPLEPGKERLMRDVAFAIDGSTKVSAEAFGVVARFINEHGWATQRLLNVRLLKMSLNAANINNIMTVFILTTWKFTAENVVGMMFDRAAVNLKSMREIQDGVFPSMHGMECIPHTLANVGKKIEDEAMDNFMSGWINIMSRSPAARALFQQMTDTAGKRANLTRWFASWEVLFQVCVMFGDVRPFLLKCQELGYADANVKKCLEMLATPGLKVKVALAAVADCDFLIKTTYDLEGDGILAIVAFDALALLDERIRSFRVGHQHPMLTSVAREIAAGNAVVEAELAAHGRSILEPAWAYWNDKSTGDLHELRALFEACRLANPRKINDIDPLTVPALLQRFKFLHDDVYGVDLVTPLMLELPVYRAEAAGLTDPERDVNAWWITQRDKVPHWWKLFCKVALLQPSSAAAERVFSMVDALFKEQQSRVLSDLVEGACMTRYNDAQRQHDFERAFGAVVI